MSIQNIILSSLANLHTDDGDLRGALNQILNIKNGSWVPIIDITENKDILTLYVELPGIHTDIKVQFHNNKLTISGNKQKIYSTTDVSIKNEIGYGKYSRNVILPIYIYNKKNVSTTYEDGILFIKINKKNEESNQFVINIGSENKSLDDN